MQTAAPTNGKLTDDTAVVEMQHTLDYVNALWPDDSAPGYLLAWALEGKRSTWFRPESMGDLAAFVNKMKDRNLYLGCGLSPTDQGPFNRCESKQVIGIPGLWADIDIAGDAHKGKALPPDLSSALALAKAMPLPPSIIVHSGHGIYPWW